jgi:hypothetical protein
MKAPPMASNANVVGSGTDGPEPVNSTAPEKFDIESVPDWSVKCRRSSEFLQAC